MIAETDLSWLAVFVIPLVFLAVAFVINGFPSIHIGSKHYHKHYHGDEDGSESENKESRERRD